MLFFSCVNLHMVSCTSTCYSIFLSTPDDKVVDDAWPSAILSPEAECLVRYALVGELERLIPHVPAHSMRPFFVEKSLPHLQPFCLAPRRAPNVARATKKQVPVHLCVFETERTLVLFAADEEGVAVDAPEDLVVGCELGE